MVSLSPCPVGILFSSFHPWTVFSKTLFRVVWDVPLCPCRIDPERNLLDPLGPGTYRGKVRDKGIDVSFREDVVGP